MFDTKFKNTNMRALGCYPVERGKDLSLIKFAMGALQKKDAIVMFPEGMRAFNSEDALALRNGAAMIAIKAGVPIVPMVLKRAPRPFVFNALKVGTTISTEQYQGRKMEKSDLAEVSCKIQESMANLLDGFEVKKKPKWWELEKSVISRGIVIINNKLLAIKRVRENGGVKKDSLELGDVASGRQEYYVLPGGHIDQGETARDAAAREVLEETGVDTSPMRILYKYKYIDEQGKAGMQSFYYCTYKSGDIGRTDAEEYTDFSRGLGTYEPVLLDLESLGGIDLRPDCIRDQLCRDIKKYGVNLARQTKYVK